jgi:6-phosphogluconolactonase (cycloisomerase 2 family)
MPPLAHGLTLTRRIRSALFVALAASVSHAALAAETHTVYIDENVPTANANAVLAYSINKDGSLTPVKGSPFLTGGTGFADPSFKLGPFDVDQEVTLNADSSVLYAVNAGSNSISAFSIATDGSLTPIAGQPFSAHGATPVSLGLRDDTLVTIDNAQNPLLVPGTRRPVITVSKILPNGALSSLVDPRIVLPTTAQPSQALTTNTKPFIFTAEFPGDGSLRAFYESKDGQLRQTDHVLLPMETIKGKATQPLPLGLWAHPTQPYLYVGFVNTSELGVYHWTATGKLDFVTKVPNKGKAICWLRVSTDGKYLYTANTASESMSVYDLTDPTNPVEIQDVVIGGKGGVQQFSLTPEGDYLYLLQQENSTASVGHSNKLYVLKVDATTGKLTLLDKDTVTLPVAAKTRPFGVAIR